MIKILNNDSPSFDNQLPPTGQTTSYIVGDDGTYQAGLQINDRFEIVTLSGDDVVKDHATGLMWPKNLGHISTTERTLQQCITDANSATVGGFGDWKLPNILEAISIYNAELNAVYSVFTDPLWMTWTSTTFKGDTTNAFVTIWQGTGGGQTKLWVNTTVRNASICRRFK